MPTESDPSMVECVLDTSVWVAVLNDEPAAAALPAAQGRARTVTTPIVLAELAALEGLSRLRGPSVIEDVEKRARLEPLTREDAIEGARTYARLRKDGRTKVGLADALIHATAQRVGATLITLDADLKGESDVIVLPGRRTR